MAAETTPLRDTSPWISDPIRQAFAKALTLIHLKRHSLWPVLCYNGGVTQVSGRLTMGIFSRIGEIINANINNMLDRAEDPEKMIRLMIHEMEDTLTEVKSSAAEVIAERIRIERRLRETVRERDEWEARAALALEKGREDLAREALERKLSYDGKIAEVQKRQDEATATVTEYQEDIRRLEEKLSSAYRRKKELLTQMKRAKARHKVEDNLAKARSASAFDRFEAYNERLDRMEAEIEVNRAAPSDGLVDRFKELENSSVVDEELSKLKAKIGKKKS